MRRVGLKKSCFVEMKILELFSGTGSVGKVAQKLGYEVTSLDIEKKTQPYVVYVHHGI